MKSKISVNDQVIYEGHVAKVIGPPDEFGELKIRLKGKDYYVFVEELKLKKNRKIPAGRL